MSWWNPYVIMKVYKKEDVDTHLRSADKIWNECLWQESLLLKRMKSSKRWEGDLKKKLKKQAKITEQMRELKKAQGAPDALKKAI